MHVKAKQRLRPIREISYSFANFFKDNEKTDEHKKMNTSPVILTDIESVKHYSSGFISKKDNTLAAQTQRPRSKL